MAVYAFNPSRSRWIYEASLVHRTSSRAAEVTQGNPVSTPKVKMFICSLISLLCVHGRVPRWPCRGLRTAEGASFLHLMELGHVTPPPVLTASVFTAEPSCWALQIPSLKESHWEGMCSVCHCGIVWFLRKRPGFRVVPSKGSQGCFLLCKRKSLLPAGPSFSPSLTPGWPLF